MSKPKKDNSVDCIFCAIAEHLVPASIRYEDDEIIAFDDINPSTPIHVLVIPKKHWASLAEVPVSGEKLLGKLLYCCKLLAEELNIADSGYRVTINTGKWGGQIVPHLHLHLLGGAPLTERLSMYTEVKTKAEKS
ncbi:histidine triad nucleotide-binding protein [Patescibacteria group bacterium]|nr:histidine triad nucleotide-binding protein [Patescibacteria group bacterium]MBU1082841.1 histidine triad nucleotide-binding protein [Patescibacteria group bacterium]